MRAFLDANVLFSAAYQKSSGLLSLWSLSGVVLVVSPTVVEEARRNLAMASADALARLDMLLERVEVNYATQVSRDHGLPDKDIHVLESALGADCAYLITGDRTHFGHLYGQSLAGLIVVTPRQFLELD